MRIPYISAVRLQYITAVVVFRVLLLSGCATESPTDPSTSGMLPASPGHGSGTLQVVGEAAIEDAGANDYLTIFSATVSDSLGAPVSGASVTFEGAFGRWTLAEDDATPGYYTSSRTGFVAGSYTLNVRAGADSLAGLTAWAPQMHAITDPVPNQTVTADAALNVRWTIPEKAYECRLTTRDYDSGWIYGDTQTLWVPSVGNPPRNDQRIRVLRRNLQLTTEGLSISRLSVSIRRTVEPIIAQ